MASCFIIKGKVLHNYRLWNDLCEKNSAKLNVVSKFCLSNPSVIRVLRSVPDYPCHAIADSNMENFSRLEKEDAAHLVKCVIKTRLSDIKCIPSLPPEYRPDRLYVSDRAMLAAIADLPKPLRPQVVLIAETGDMKDGFLPAEILEIVAFWKELDIIGISVNFSCLSGILPDITTIQNLAQLAQTVRKTRCLKSPFLSIGGTVVYDIAVSGGLKGLVQEIRVGEGIFFGYNSSGGSALPGFETKTIAFEGEVLEVSDKDFSLQKGHEAGFTATGGHGGVSDEKFETGVRRRAVLDFGVLAASASDLTPVDTGVVPVGQTFDFTVVDVTDCKKDFHTGESIRFFTDYASASFCMMNRFIPCTFIEEDSCYER